MPRKTDPQLHRYYVETATERLGPFSETGAKRKATATGGTIVEDDGKQPERTGPSPEDVAAAVKALEAELSSPAFAAALEVTDKVLAELPAAPSGHEHVDGPSASQLAQHPSCTSCGLGDVDPAQDCRGCGYNAELAASLSITNVASEDRLERLQLAKQETKALRAWEADGGDLSGKGKPATPNLDAINEAAASKAKPRSSKPATTARERRTPTIARTRKRATVDATADGYEERQQTDEAIIEEHLAEAKRLAASGSVTAAREVADDEAALEQLRAAKPAEGLEHHVLLTEDDGNLTAHRMSCKKASRDRGASTQVAADQGATPATCCKPELPAARKAPRAAGGTMQYHRNGKPLSPQTNRLSYLAATCTQGMTAAPRMPKTDFTAYLASKGITAPEATAWELELPNGVKVGGAPRT